MRWNPLLIAPFAVVINAPAEATVYLTVEQAQRVLFPGATFSSAGGNVWRVSTGGYFVVDRVLGKHEYITYAVGVTSAGTVKGVEILQYNESYGYEVRQASWRSQFVGKSASSQLQLNSDIKNITGATLSAKHITDGVRRVLQKIGRQ